MDFGVIQILFCGIWSGLIATILVFIGGRYWNKIVVPWYENRVYKDVSIAGEWTVIGEEGENFSEVVKVTQRAHHVWGNIIYRKNNKLIEYEFKGEVKNLILTATYCGKGASDLDRGTFTLMVSNNGKTMNGFYAWYLDEKNDVVSGKYVWNRD